MTSTINRFFILFFLTFLPPGILFAAIGEKDFHFHHLSVNQGLSQYDITAIVQDVVGYVWIGTYDGLNRYNGYENIIFRHKDASENVIPGNRVLCLTEGPDRNIWIGTEDGGVGVYNIFTDRFMSVKSQASSPPNSISALYFYDGNIIAGTTSGSIYISAVTSNKDTVYVDFKEVKLPRENLDYGLVYVSSIERIDNTLLIGFNEGGLIQIKQQGGDFLIQQLITEVSTSDIYVDKQKQVWAGTYYGLKCYRYVNESDTIIDITPDIVKNSEEHQVTSVYEDNNGNIWYTTYLKGLFQLQNTEDGQWIVNNYSSQNSGISTDKLSTTFIDKYNTLWIGSHNDGVRMIDLYQKDFYRVSFFYDNLNISEDQNIIAKSCYVDQYGKVWVGLSDEALFVHHQDGEVKKFSTSEPEYRLHSNTITKIIEDRKGNLWLTSYEGIYRLSAANNKSGNYIFEQIDTSIENAEKVNQGAFYTVCEDSYGNIWVGGRSGLLKCKISGSGKCTGIVDYTHHIEQAGGSYYWVMSILPGPELNRIFVGTQGGGLYQLVYKNDSDVVEVKELTSQSNPPDVLFNKNVWALYGLNKELWVGTDEGVYIFSRNKDQYDFSRRLSVDNGLSSSKVESIESDLSGNIWMGTGFGLSKYEVKDSTITNYFYDDGLPNNAFNSASASDRQGRLYFAGISGIIYFNPDDISENPRVSDIQITNMFINYQKLEPGSVTNKKEVIEKSIPFIKDVKLDHLENNFFIEFSTFDFFKPNNISCEYKLEGFDKEWIRSYKNSRVAYYSAVPPGDYTFRIRLINNLDAAVLSEKSLLISISPSPWLTWWAFVIYLLLFIGIAYSVFYHFREKHRYKNRILIEKYKREQEHELNEMKLKFFLDISHELRTPLVLIMEPLRILINKINGNQKLNKYLNIANINAQKLYHFTTQLLDFRLVDSGNVSFNPVKDDIVAFSRVLNDSFTTITDKNSISFHFVNKVKFIEMYFDKDIIDKILSNLLSNAIKFSNSGGRIDFIISLHENNGKEEVEFEVKDNGTGIPYDMQDTVFQRFKHSKERPGFGIGLSLSKGLAEVHGGSLSFESEPGKGSSFYLKIPLIDHPEVKFQKDSPVFHESDYQKEWIIKGDFSYSNLSDEKIIPEPRSTILLAEDNAELREFLVSFLRENFTVISAVNGQEAFELAVKDLPDIVITDIMMPVLDGITLAKKLSANSQTNHIPLIFLTAKSMTIDQVLGMGTGAVDFIIKPFSVRFLQAKIENLLHILKLQQAKNWSNLLHETDKSAGEINSDPFVMEACKIINKNIGNSDFSISEFCKELGVSRMNLHRKLKGAVGLSTSEFIRNLKMKHAAMLLLTGKYNISEAMYEVGFDNPSYFTKSFKTVYGVSPSEYLLKKPEPSRTKTNN